MLIVFAAPAAPAALDAPGREQLVTATAKAMRTAAANGWLATHGPRDTYYVPSQSRVRTARTVQAFVGQDDTLWFSCSCESGYYRGTEPLSCWHGAATAVLMYREGSCFPDHGIFRTRRSTDRERDAHGRFTRTPSHATP